MKDERIEDALQYINELLELLKNFATTNDTPEGRTKHMLNWYKQEIEGGRLTQLPLPEEQTSTIRHIYSEDYLVRIDVPRQKRLKKLISLLGGRYLMKPQFYPLVIEEIDKMLGLLGQIPAAKQAIPPAEVETFRAIPRKQITAEQKHIILGYVVFDLRLLRSRFVDHSIEPPPVNWDDYMGASVGHEKSIFGSYKSCPEEIQWERLCCLIFEGLRPDPEGKIRNRRW